MSAQILDGKGLARTLQAHFQDKIRHAVAEGNRPPGLAVLMVGDNPASATYVRNKEKACQRVGITSFGHHFEATATAEEILATIHTLNQDPRVDGILLQLPVPTHLDATQLLLAIDPDKDVDGLHPVNLGRLVRGEPGLRSCTPYGVMRLLETGSIPIAGQQAVVVGRSLLVGKPMSLMLLEANATVIMAHSHTADLVAITRTADILVVATGRPQMITANMVKPGSVVVDVGINRVTTEEGSRLVGDVDIDSVQTVARALTPVPGGVGPMTVTMLLENTLTSYTQHINVRVRDV